MTTFAATDSALPRVVLVDDHAVIRDGVRLLLESSGLANVVAEAADGEEAVRQIEWHKPDLVVLDVDMPRLNGFQVLNRLFDLPDIATKILMLSMYSDAGVAASLLKVGASGFVCKRSGLQEVIKAIGAILANKEYRNRNTDAPKSESRDESQRLDRLSAREREVLIHLARGCSAKLTARAMNIMPSTVHVYRTKIREKLEISSLAELARLAIRHGLSELQPTTAPPLAA